METKFSGGDDISFVSTASGKSGFYSTIPKQPSRNMKFQGVISGLAFAILLFLSILIVIILLRQNTAMASLADQVQDLQKSVKQLDDEIGNLPKSIKREYPTGQNPIDQGSQPEKLSTTKASPVEQTIDFQVFDILQELKMSISSLAVDMRSNFGDFQKEIGDVSTDLQGMEKFLSDSKGSIHDMKETILMKFNNAIDNISQSMRETHANIVNVMERNSASGNASDEIEEILSAATGVDAGVTQIKGFMDVIENYLTLLHDQFNASKLTERLKDISHQVKMIRLDKNESLSITTYLEAAKIQRAEILAKMDNISMIQLQFLLKSQAKIISEMKREFDILHKKRETPESDNITLSIPVNETFCNHKGKCVNKTVTFQHCYLIPNFKYNRLSWKDAKSKCEKLGGYLAEVNSVSEMQFLENVVSRKGFYWLGAHDLTSDRKWVWQHSGQPMLLNAWKGHRGRGHGPHSGGHCLAATQGIGRWHPGPCSKALGYICERNDGKCWE